METRLIVLMVLILVGNATVLWFLVWLLKSLKQKTSQYCEPSAKTIEAVAARLGQAESASAVLVRWSGRVRRLVVGADDDFERAEDWIRFGLAKIDFNVEKASEQLDATAQRISASVSEPLYRTATVIQGVKALLELLTLQRCRDGGAGPRSAA